ncbi:MAG: universal stress protein [Vicinamibacterales bacterium]
MIAFKQVLCPIDFSETSRRALTYAAALASMYGAELEVLHVVPTIDDHLTTWWPNADACPPRLDAEAEAAITAEIHQTVSGVGTRGVHVRAIVREGRAHEVIVGRAQVQPADLVVMGTHGRSGVNRLLLGSVTEKVVRTASCPVLTVPPGVHASAGAPVSLGHILCPIDYSKSSLEALRWAVDLARQANGVLTVLHALEYMSDELAEPSPFEPSGQTIAELRARRQQIVDHARAQLHASATQESTTRCTIQEVLAVDRAYKAILRHAEALPADLIVMGAQGSDGLELMLYGSNTQHVVRAAACPVLTVRG